MTMESPSVPDTASVHDPAPWRPDTRVRLASRVSLDLSETVLRLDARGGPHTFPRSVLPLLAFFESPHTLQEGLDWLAPQAKGTAGLAEAFGALLRLGELGVLEREDGARPGVAEDPEAGFGPAAQIRMLEDRTRTSKLIEAIRRTVKPEHVVLDLGTGTGILALAAARAGARRVYAIEALPIAETAARLFESSGLGDRITLVRGRSLDLNLPERADVLISEILGHDPLGEGLVETLTDAVGRFLKPGGRLLPDRVRILATPVQVPERVAGRFCFRRTLLEAWEARYGLPLRALEAPPAGREGAWPLERQFVLPQEARGWKALGPSFPLTTLDLADPALARSAAVADFEVDRPGRLGGLLEHWEARLAPGLELSTSRFKVDRWNHWKNLLWLLPEPLRIPRGLRARLMVEARRNRASLGWVASGDQAASG